jgi:Uncharacterized protein conserved in bacteria (DUF2188)
MPTTRRLHVHPDPSGRWRVQPEGEEQVLSEHSSESEAERAAARHAAPGDICEIVVHDRYHRVHTLYRARPGASAADEPRRRAARPARGTSPHALPQR